MLQSGQDNFMIDIQMKGKISKIDLYLYWQLVQYNFSEVLEEETWTEYTGTNKSLTNLSVQFVVNLNNTLKVDYHSL